MGVGGVIFQELYMTYVIYNVKQNPEEAGVDVGELRAGVGKRAHDFESRWTVRFVNGDDPIIRLHQIKADGAVYEFTA